MTRRRFRPVVAGMVLLWLAVLTCLILLLIFPV